MVNLPLMCRNSLISKTLQADEFSYQWQTGGVDIVDAVESVYFGAEEVGKATTVVVSYTDGKGTVESVVSAASSVVTEKNEPVAGAVLITGTPNQGNVLTADTSGVSDPDGLAN